MPHPTWMLRNLNNNGTPAENAKEESFWSSFSRKGPNARRANFAAANQCIKQTMPRIKARGLCDCVGICLALAGLRMSTQSAKLTVRGRALASRHNSDVARVLSIKQQTIDPVKRRDNIFTQTERAWTFELSTLILLLLPRPIWSGVSCSIYCFVAASLWCLDREALPLELSASLSRKA
ncbi:hypothetical protein SAMN05216469_106154 [Ruminococcus albus]|uniref:Uncharacterized protein n=1 Tax=Ruminococcus albus TaxID=1264 RepID=A0A1H7KBI6_RUMAL|nr:hypothetical protein SAMN05216469_106154 [Ruminococcus albus]